MKGVASTAGQPKRATARPTTEQILRAFKGISLVVLQTGATQERHLTALTPVQKHILKLLKFPATLYAAPTQFLETRPQNGRTVSAILGQKYNFG